MLVCDDFSKNCHVIQKVFLAFLKDVKLLNMCAFRKKYDRDNFTPTPRQPLRGQNTLVGIG